jgi:hypothetical protein
MDIFKRSAPTGQSFDLILLRTEEGNFVLKAFENWSVPERIHSIYTQ